MELSGELAPGLATVEGGDLLSAATAFFKWRQAALKANFRRELEGILDEVAQEEEATSRTQKQLQRTQERLDETVAALAKVGNDHRTALLHNDQLRAQSDELFKALEAAEGASRTHAEQARAATIMHQEEAKRRQEEGRASKLELDGLREQYNALAAQQQTLLESLAQRDREVAEATQEGLHHKRNAARLEEDVNRLEGILRATGERAAAAEAQAAARQETIGQLYAQLAGLRERYHAELSELKAARMGAAEVARMRERMDSMQNTNDSLVAARDELRASLEGVMAKLAAAEARLKRQAVQATMRGEIIEAITAVARGSQGNDEDGQFLAATTRLSSELDLALANAADLAERLAASDAVVAQQQGHIRRMAEECGSLEGQLREARDARQQQHTTISELTAELQRLAAEAALGPLMILDRNGQLVPAERPPAAPRSATAPAISQLEAQATAVRVILADKGFGLGSLVAAIAAKPGPVLAVRAQLGECRALAESLRVCVGEVGDLLGVRPFEAEDLARQLPLLQDKLVKTEACFVAAREELANKQVHAVSLEARVLAAESALRSAASLLQGWSGLLSEVAAAEDGRLEPDVRLGLREELKTREDALHRCTLDLAAAAPALLSGDPAYAAAHVALRDAGNAMMELSLTLGDRLVDAPATRTRALHTESLLLDRATQLGRFRELLAGAPGELADAVERLTALLPEVQAMGPAVEEMLRCVQGFLAAGRAEEVDVVALQGEVLSLRGLVRAKDAAIQALEAVGTGIRTGSPTKRALKMVPLEALHAAERSRDGLSGEKAALQVRLVDQRVRLVGARHRLVAYMAAVRESCEAAEVFFKWRAAVAGIKAERENEAMRAAQLEAARLEKQGADDMHRMEKEAEALRGAHAEEVKSLTATHLAEVTTLTTAHTAQVAAMAMEREEERKAAQKAALEAAERRVVALRRAFKEQSHRYRECLLFCSFYYWRIRCAKQAAARQHWRDLSVRLRAAEERPDPTYLELLHGPRLTVARRLLRRRRCLGADGEHVDLVTPSALSGLQVARAILHTWRSWAYLKRQLHKMDALTESLPPFIANMGDRRRLERAWLGLRLWAAGCATRRAHEAIQEYEGAKAAVEAAAAAAAAEAADEEARRAAGLMAADAAAAASSLLPLPAGGYDAVGVSTGGMGAMYGTEGGRGAYLPNVHTVLGVGASAPRHSAAQDAVAAAQEAGLPVITLQPLNAALQHLPPAHVQQPQFAGLGGGQRPPALGAPMPLQLERGGGGWGADAVVARTVEAPPSAPQHWQHRGPSDPGGAADGWHGSTAGGRGPPPVPVLPPVAGPSEARLRALAERRRRSAPGGGYLSDAAAGGGRRNAQQLRGRSVSGAAGGGRGVVPPGAPWPAGPEGGPSAVATLADRAARLAEAMGAISAGVSDTHALLSPRTRLLQSALHAATEMQQQQYEEEEGGGAAYGGSPSARSAPASPVRRIQSDGTIAVQYDALPQEASDGVLTAGLRSPSRAGTERSDTEAGSRRTGQQRQQRPAHATYAVERGSAGAPSEASAGGRNRRATATTASQRSGPSVRSAVRSGSQVVGARLPVARAIQLPPGAGSPPRAGGEEQREPATAAAGGPQLPNSVQMLLRSVPGRAKPIRGEPHPVTRVVPPAPGPAARRQPGSATASASGPYAHVGSRLGEETVSTIAKKKLPGRPPERGVTNLLLLPPPPLLPAAGPLSSVLPGRTSVPGPVTAAQLEVVQAAPAASALAWPHQPASSALLPGGPSAAQPMRRRGDPADAHHYPQPYPQPYPQHQPHPQQYSQQQEPPLSTSVTFSAVPGGGGAASFSTWAQAGPGAAQGPGQVGEPVATRVGKVVRFERMSPAPGSAAGMGGGWPGQEGAPEGGQAAAGSPEGGLLAAQGSPRMTASEGGAGGGPVTYIQLPSPVRVSIRMP